MSKKRFVVIEYMPCAWGLPTISEIELEFRINTIVSISQGPNCSMDKIKHILLYGYQSSYPVGAIDEN